MPKTYAQQLEEVEAAIEAIEGGAQSYNIDNRSLTRANLETLYKRQTYLKGKAAREARGGGVRTRYGTAVQ
jgi:hypothetical protein